MPTIAFIAHPGLAAGPCDGLAAWERAAERVAQLEPALTVVLGNLTAGAATHPEQLLAAAEHLDDWPTPVRCVPGPADIGRPRSRGAVERGALLRFRRAIGADRWCHVLGSWHVVGLNAALLGSGSEEEAQQRAWLEAVAALRDHRHLVLCLDRPLTVAATAHGSDPGSDGLQDLLTGLVGERIAAVLAAAPPTHRLPTVPLLQTVIAGPPGRAKPVEQLVIGAPKTGLGWLTLEAVGSEREPELGIAQLDRAPAGDQRPSPSDMILV